MREKERPGYWQNVCPYLSCRAAENPGHVALRSRIASVYGRGTQCWDPCVCGREGGLCQRYTRRSQFHHIISKKTCVLQHHAKKWQGMNDTWSAVRGDGDG